MRKLQKQKVEIIEQGTVLLELISKEVAARKDGFSDLQMQLQLLKYSLIKLV
jgi:hypothetical protein